MSFPENNNSSKGYVCPSDRQLALRAKLQTGWSSKCKRVPLTEEEQQVILSVIKRNEQLELAERQRVGKLVERVERIKLRSSFHGPKNCSLCGAAFGITIRLNMTHKQICYDCNKPVCSHCCIEISNSSSSRKSIWLCHVCSEIRDIYKKTGAWFYKGLPKFDVEYHRSGDDKKISNEERQKSLKSSKTTKLGMEIESEEEEDDEGRGGDDVKFVKSGSFGSGFLKNKNIFSLRLTTTDSNVTSKKSPVSPYSRQTSSSDSQKSAVSLQPNLEWETPPAPTTNQNGTSLKQHRRSSISSCYSITENLIHHEVAALNPNHREPIVLGWLEVSINYDESQDALYCTILRARDLPAMDAQGLADPFCKINIITAENILRHTRWQKSKIAHKTNNPEFNETFSFIGLLLEELNSSSVFIVLLDDDKYGNDFLGSAKISLAMYLQNNKPCRVTVPLGPEDRFSMESLSTDSNNGQILISLCYNTQKRALSVVIKRCINLLAMDKNGFSDAFVKLQLRPDSHKRKFKTSIKWRNLNPIFNEEFFFETRPNDLDKQSLIVTVWDKDIGKSNDFLGSLILGQNSKGRRLKQWKDCIILPDQYHEHWHFLSSEIPHHH